MLSVQELYKAYRVGANTYEVLKGVSLEVEKGEFVAVMGSSGSGKTTLLNCISCYIPADRGSIRLAGEELAQLDEAALANVRNQKLGFIFQDFLLLDGLSVQDNILLPRIILSSGYTSSADSSGQDTAGSIIRRRGAGSRHNGRRDHGGMEQEAAYLCDLFGITPIRHKFPAEISGGERQRTAVARALINHPLLILADEPTGNLDSKSSRAVIDSFLQAKQSLEATIFMVTHDSFAASFCDRVIILRDGVVWRVLTHTGDRGAFQDALLDAIREMGQEESA